MGGTVGSVPQRKGSLKRLRFPAWPGSAGTHSSRHCATGARKTGPGSPLARLGGLLCSPPRCPAVQRIQLLTFAAGAAANPIPALSVVSSGLLSRLKVF